MSFAGRGGAGGPLIAGTPMASNGYRDASDGDFSFDAYLDLSECQDADTLQSLHSVNDQAQKKLAAPQEVSTSSLPDSPNGSSQDSSSESAASSKRNGSTSSDKTAMKVEEAASNGADVNMHWDESSLNVFGDHDNAFHFANGSNSSNTNGVFSFGHHDDMLMDQTSDVVSMTASPDDAQQLSPPLVDASSPELPRKKAQASKRRSHKPQQRTSNGHKKRPSQLSASSAMHGLQTPGSREVSPLTNAVTSQHSSPSQFFSPATSASGLAFSAPPNGHTPIWPNGLDAVTPQPFPGAMQFNGPVAHHGILPPQIPSHTPLFYQPQCPNPEPVRLSVHKAPSKSRVETQISLTLALWNAPSVFAKLHLPPSTISKPKLLAKPKSRRSPDTLELSVSVYCTSAISTPELRRRALERASKHAQDYLPDLNDPEFSPQNGGEVRICAGCMNREAKRSARKKIKKPEEEERWKQDESRRVVVFNTHEIKDWQPGNELLEPGGHGNGPNVLQAQLPMRIACYCRHHGEKMGFNVVFTLKDYRDQHVAQVMSEPIMITDDHKTHTTAQLPTSQGSAAPDASDLSSCAQKEGLRYSQSAADLTTMHKAVSPGASSTGMPTHAMSRPASPSPLAPQAKKRKSSGSKVPDALAMTRMSASPTPNIATANSYSNASPSTTFPGSPNAFPQFDQVLSQMAAQTFVAQTPTPTNEQRHTNARESMDHSTMAQLYSAPASNHPSRAPSPGGSRNENPGIAQSQLAQALANNLYSMPTQASQMRSSPVIHKIIPSEGPTIGGIEVTVLGAAFFQGLEVWFGDTKATTTTFWGESSLVCLLPPSPISGPVPVIFKQQSGAGHQHLPLAKQPPTFRYIEDNEDKLIRTALSVLGHKISGHMMDINDLARAVLNHESSGNWQGGSAGGMPSSGGAPYNQASRGHLETQLLKCLDLIDLDDSTHRTNLDLKRSTGHTMLHLACALGYHRFVAALLARGANSDARDKGGFTPLHMAVLHNQPEIVRRLMLSGADPTIRSLSGLRPVDIAPSRALRRAISHSQRHVRSRSGGSLHSRSSSATSMRSMWEPLSKINTHDEPIISTDSGEESLEYTSGDFEEDGDSDDADVISMRRSSTFRRGRDRASLARRGTGELDDDAGAAMAVPAIKDQLQQQFQQFQQSMTMHLQNLPQMPQMPHMPALPGMPMLPDYQAYFQRPPFMRRVQQWMPNMPGPRPNSADGEHGKLDHRWWDLSSYMNNGSSPSPPPAYEDIFPQEEMDRKQASALQAAVDTEADMKCASTYDQTEATTSASPQRAEVPSVLKIGRKNAITKEQQEQFLRAREEKLKVLSSDKNLFFIWIPLLVAMICAMTYRYFPSFFPLVFATLRTLFLAGRNRATQMIREIPNRVVEV